MHVGRQMHGESALTDFDGLGIYRLLALIPDGADLHCFVEESLGELATDDSPENADLRRTLSVLIDTNLTSPRPRGSCSSTTTRCATASPSSSGCSARSPPTRSCGSRWPSRCGSTRCAASEAGVSIAEAQADARRVYSGGFQGQLVSAVIWLLGRQRPSGCPPGARSSCSSWAGP